MLPGPTLIITCAQCGAPHRTETLESGNTFGAEFWSDGKMRAPMLPEEPTFTKCTACGALQWVSDMPQAGHSLPWGNSICREPISFNVVIADVWDDTNLVAQRLAMRLACSVQEAHSKLQALPITVNEDVARATADALADEFEELGVNIEVTPCRVSTESVPPDWFTAPDVPFVSALDYMTALARGLAQTVDDEIFLRVAAWHVGNDGFRDGGCAWVPYSNRQAWSVENLERLLEILDKSKGPCRVMAGEICRQLCRFRDAKLWLDAADLQSAVYEDDNQKSGVLDVAGVLFQLANRGEPALTRLPAPPE